jgi:phage I-like protein
MNNSHVVIFNRSALQSTDGWIHIVPKGELPNREAGIVQVLDDESLDSILAGIEKDKNRLGDNWPGLYAGREHFIYDADQDSAALAWFKDFEKRADGIWAKENGLTDTGTTAIRNRDYKFTSFVADRSDLKKIVGNRYRVMKIETVGFTNQANGKELLTPIRNRTEITLAGAVAPADSQHPNQGPRKMKTVCTALGLSADAAEDVVLAEVTKLKNRVTELAPLAEDNKTLKTRLESLDGEQVDGLLETHGVKEPKVINRLKPVLTALKNREERVAALVDFGFTPPAAGTQARVLNRGAGNLRNVVEDDVAAQTERATKIMNRAVAIQKETPTISLATATAMATKEIK